MAKKATSRPKAAELLGKTFTLATLLDYQKDAVVSREIIKKKTGSVTLFAFDKGQGLSEHTAPFDAMVYVADGGVEIRIAGKRHLLKKGETIVMPANKPHSLKAIRKFKMLLVMVRG